jgi:hypothetical protein
VWKNGVQKEEQEKERQRKERIGKRRRKGRLGLLSERES